jgi:hypothetical protein
MYTIVVSSANERGGKGHDDVSVGFQSDSESQSELELLFFNASGVGLSPLYCGHFWPIVPAPR